MQTDWQKELDNAKEYVRKLNVISTNKDKEIDVDDEKDEVEVNSVIDILTGWSDCKASLMTIAGQLRKESKMEFVRGIVGSG